MTAPNKSGTLRGNWKTHLGVRDSVMSARMQSVLHANPRTRTLLLVNGLSSLRGGRGLVRGGAW